MTNRPLAGAVEIETSPQEIHQVHLGEGEPDYGVGRAGVSIPATGRVMRASGSAFESGSGSSRPH